MRRRLHQPVRQLSIIRQEQQSLTCIIEASDRIYSPFNAPNQIHHRRPLLRITDGRYISFGLVQQKIYMSVLAALKQLSIDANVIGVRDRPWCRVR